MNLDPRNYNLTPLYSLALERFIFDMCLKLRELEEEIETLKNKDSSTNDKP